MEKICFRIITLIDKNKIISEGETVTEAKEI